MTPAPEPMRRASWLSAPAWWAIGLAAFVLQLPLALNPGYFSHDELQWAAFAAADRHVAWLDVGQFQYRPLTFGLWMWLSRLLFDTPQAFHALLVAWGAANVAGLYALGCRLAIPSRHVAVAALVFALAPYAVVVHGWVGTIADLAWLSCALLAAFAAQRLRSPGVVALLAALATVTGLLAKEAAMSIPVLAAVAWAFTRERRWVAATAGAGAATLAYLALRLDTLLDGPDVPLYAAKVSNIAVRWVEYQLFTPILRLPEAHATLSTPVKYLVVAAFLWCAYIAALWRADRRIAAFAIVGGGAALGPVLLLGQATNHYAYAFAAVQALCGAAAWARTARWGRMALGTYALLAVLHGIVVMGVVFEVGRVQAVFSPALAQALRTWPPGAPPLRLAPEPDAKAWMFRRLTHEIPSYDGVPIGKRIVLVEAGAPADYRIARDGRLLPAPH